MKTLVIYDSFFGNTKKIANAIGGALGTPSEVPVCHVNEANQDRLKDVRLLIVGSPTRAFRPTPAIKKFIKNLPARSLEGIKVSAFDTRIKIDERTPRILQMFAGIFGFAAKPILDDLIRKGGDQVTPAEGFLVVDSEGPLAEGELERAAEWAKRISQSLE